MSLPLSKGWNALCRWSFTAFVLSLPFQSAVLIYQSDWGRGFLNPYVTITLTIQELFLWTAALSFLISHFKNKWKWGDSKFLIIFTLGLATTQTSLLVSPYTDAELHLLLAAKILETVLLYFLVTNRVLPQNKILKLFIAVMTGEALLGIFQVLTQSSVGLHILGEPFLSTTTAHLAKIQWDSWTWIRAYGTFPHPNVMGGFLVISLLATFLYNPTKKYEREILLLIQFLGLIFTCSRSALLAFSFSVVLLCLWYANKLKRESKEVLFLSGGIFSLELVFLFWSRGTLPWNDPALLSRWSGYKEALALFWRHPLGVGWNHYTLFLDQASPQALQPWDYEPVHNLYLLALTETGVLGFIFAVITSVLILKKMFSLHKTLSTTSLEFKKRTYFLMGTSVLLIGCFDHYWMTLEQGRWLLILLWAMFSYFVSDPLHVFPIRKVGKSQ